MFSSPQSDSFDDDIPSPGPRRQAGRNYMTPGRVRHDNTPPRDSPQLSTRHRTPRRGEASPQRRGQTSPLGPGARSPQRRPPPPPPRGRRGQISRDVEILAATTLTSLSIGNPSRACQTNAKEERSGARSWNDFDTENEEYEDARSSPSELTRYTDPSASRSQGGQGRFVSGSSVSRSEM